MVDIQPLPSSSSSSAMSSSSSSSSDSSSSSSSSSSSDSSTSTLSERRRGQEENKCQQQDVITHRADNSAIMPLASTTMQRETGILEESMSTINQECKVPVETVVCLDTTAKTASQEQNDENLPPPPQDDDDDFPYFEPDDSLPTTTPDKHENDDPYSNGGLSDQDLAKLLDSPEVIAKTSGITTTNANVTTTNAPPQGNDKPKQQGVYDSPSIDSSIDSDNLEIPHSATPEKKKAASSRFFSSNINITDAKIKSSTAAVLRTKPTKRSNNASSYPPPSYDSTVLERDHHVQQAQDLSFKSNASTRPQERQEPTTTLATTEPRLLERTVEVDPSLYQPPPFRPRPDPIVHFLTSTSRPKHTRREIAVTQLFSSPLNKLWLSKFSTFNHLQSQVADTLAHSDDSIVVSAPTGAGKTALFEIGMARFFAADLSSFSGGHVVSNQRKIVYMAPSKALCEERFEDWSRRLSDIHVGIQCAMITGDAEPGDSFRDVAAAHVILTTPEKWDSLTRRWTENVFLFGSVKLLLVDEVHLLGDGTRGSCLESVILRIKTIQRAAVAVSGLYDPYQTSSYSNTSREALSSFLRIVGVSATLPNVSSIAAFLEVNEAYAFDASYRPVPLTTHVVGLGSAGKNAFMFGKSLDRHVPDLIKRFSQSKPTIVFCHTKKETETLAMTLSNMNGIAIRNCDNMALAGQTKLASLQRPLIRGIAYHHAGLDAPDRKLVETAFMKGKVIVLCATSTLAMGVNLPAHLVVIKGTSAWRGAEQGHQEIDKGTLLQMMGRAGRPGFDTSGIAVIMTDNVSKMKYEQLSGGMEVVESRLPSRLMDVLNTEISQRVITSLDTAQDWLKSTFFYRRVTENPRHYGLPSSEPHVEEYMEKLCLSSLELLNELGIIRFDDSGNVSPLMGCHVMSQHMVEFEAMKSIVGLPFDADQATLLKFLAECDRLHRPVRRGEKKALNEVHKLIRYKLDGPPSKVRVQSPWEKTFVLLQAAIGQHYLEEKTLRQEMSFMVEYATRILSAVEDYSIDGSMNGQVALQSLRLRRSLATCLWGPGDGVLNQLRGVGHKTTAKLRFSKISSFVDVLSATSEAIERAAGRAPPFGKELRTAVSKILAGTLQLSACLEYEGSVSKYVVCSLARRATMPGAELVDSDESAGIIKYTLVVYTDRPGGSLVVQPNITSIGEYRFPCPQTFGKIFVHLVASMVGLDERLTLDGNDSVLESSFTTNPSEKAKGKRKKQASTSFSLKGDDVRVKGRSTGKRKSKQQTIESTYASSKKQRATASQSASARAPSTNPARSQVSVPSASTSVTPSPLPPRASVKNTELVTPRPPQRPVQNYDPPAASRAQSNQENRAPVRLGGTGSQRLRGHRNSDWRKENRSQTRAPVPSSVTSVTPLPPPPSAYVKKDASTSAFHSQPNFQENHPPVRPSAPVAHQRLRGQRNSNWQHEKKSQKILQACAFRRNKENPFSSLAFSKHDPNSAEELLSASAEKVKSPMPEESIIPGPTLSEMKKSSTTPRSFKAGANYGTSGRKGRSGGTTGRGRRHRTFQPPHLDNRDLLQMKAMEQQAYEQESGCVYQPPRRQQFNPNESSFAGNSYRTYEDGSSIFPSGHPFAGGHRGYTETSVYGADPRIEWNEQHDAGMVTQSQYGYSQFMDEPTSQMPYEPQVDHNGGGYGLYSQQQSNETSSWDQADPFEFNNMQQGPPPLSGSAAFGGAPMTQQESNNGFTSRPPMNAHSYGVPVPDNGDKEDALFEVAFY